MTISSCSRFSSAAAPLSGKITPLRVWSRRAAQRRSAQPDTALTSACFVVPRQDRLRATVRPRCHGKRYRRKRLPASIGCRVRGGIVLQRCPMAGPLATSQGIKSWTNCWRDQNFRLRPQHLYVLPPGAIGPPRVGHIRPPNRPGDRRRGNQMAEILQLFCPSLSRQHPVGLPAQRFKSVIPARFRLALAQKGEKQGPKCGQGPRKSQHHRRRQSRCPVRSDSLRRGWRLRHLSVLQGISAASIQVRRFTEWPPTGRVLHPLRAAAA